MMLTQFLLDADQPVTVPGVTAPRTDFPDAAEPVRVALAQEKRVTEQIANLLRLAREEGDFVGEEAMHWFLKEQREEVSSMSDLLKLVERALGVEHPARRGLARPHAGRRPGRRRSVGAARGRRRALDAAASASRTYSATASSSISARVTLLQELVGGRALALRPQLAEERARARAA